MELNRGKTKMPAIFQSLFNAGKDLFTNLQTFSFVMAVIAGVVAGMGFFISKKTADGSKSKLGDIAIGVGVVLGVVSVITYLFQLFGATPPAF